jgi:pyridoxamine 5'-phosphate oxidase family protein
MDVFTPAELRFLDAAQSLARLATTGPDGTPHVTPVGWSLTADRRAIQIGGKNLAATQKFRDVARTGRAAAVIDQVRPPWHPQGIEVRGRAEAITEPEPQIRIHPGRVISWGFEGASGGRDTAPAQPAPTHLERDREAPDTPYVVIRKNRFDLAALTGAETALAEFQRIHAAQPGYQGNIVVDAGQGTHVTVTVWESRHHAANARSVLGPAVRRLVEPLLAEASELIAFGALVTTDLPTVAPPAKVGPVRNRRHPDKEDGS